MPETASTDTDIDAVIAKVIALAARNGVEDLHAAGAFSDRQAPSLNRRLRGRVYELLLATRERDPRQDDPFAAYVDDLADGHKGGHAVAALQGTVARAVNDFAAAEAIDTATATKLRKAAIKGAVEAYKTVTRLSLGRSKDEERDRLAVEFWLRSIPSYWEEPVVSPEFQKLLDTSAVLSQQARPSPGRPAHTAPERSARSAAMVLKRGQPGHP
jgi:hypothetical protein